MTRPDAAELIKKAYKKREALATSLSAYRLINSGADGMSGVAIDIYGPYAAVSWYLESAVPMKDAVAKALLENFELKGVYELYRFRSQGCPQNFLFVAGSPAEEFFTIEERGLKFICSFSHGQNAGFFIDNRANRDFIMETSGGKRVLNLFSYTGVLSVAAAAGGAAAVVSVDIGAAYNKWAKRNLELNGFDDAAGRVLKFDALEYMRFAARKGHRFDLVIVDPPPFAARLGGGPFGARKDYHRLIEAALKIAAPGGTILALCNMAGYGREDFERMLGGAAEKAVGKGFSIAAGPPMPPDFKCPRGGEKLDYLKNYYIRIR